VAALRSWKTALGAFKVLIRQARESSDNPMLNAFCRVAPTVRFSVLAILAAGVFFRASVFSSRTCTDVQARLLDAFLTMHDLRF
jgi:hypothetical protein